MPTRILDRFPLSLFVVLALTLFLKPMREIRWSAVIGALVGGAAVLAPAADQVVAFVEFGEQHRDVGRVVLHVRIEQDDDVTFRVVDPGGNGGSLTEVATEDHHADILWMLLCQFCQNIQTPVLRAIVHEDDLPGFADGCQSRFDGFHQQGEVVFFVIDRDDK